jgi:hypothetical protein
MTPIFPIVELVDRLAIAEVKFARTQSNHEELTWYSSQAQQFGIDTAAGEYQDLKEIHNKIWELEAELKAGRESELSLQELGSRAIKIRDYNKKRIALKNLIAERLDCPVREIKQDHLSE